MAPVFAIARRYTDIVAVLLAILFAAASVFAQPDPAFTRGTAVYRSGDCKDSLTDLATSKTPRAAVPAARCLLESGDAQRAADLLARYYQNAPDDSVAAVLLAQARERTSGTADAVKVLDDFLKRHPENTGLHAALGDIYVRANNSGQAASEFELVVKEVPTDPAAHAGLGDLALKEQRWADAIAEFEKARTASPGNFRASLGLGTAYAKQGSCDRAESPLREALDLAPTNFGLAKMLAVCLSGGQKWKEVLSALRTATPEEAADEEATALATKAFTAFKDAAGAEAYYRQILALAPTNFTAHNDYADLLYTARRVEEARAQYLEVVKLRPDTPRVQERLGDIFSAANQPAEARAHYETAAKSSNASDSSRMKLAQLCFAAKDWTCTSGALDRISSPELGQEKKLIQVQVEYALDHLPPARALADELLATSPKNLVVLRIAADVAQRQDRIQDAARLLERAVEVDPASKELRYPLVRLYLNFPELEGLDRSVTLLSDYLAKYEQDAEAYLLLGNVYRKKEDVSNARQNFQTGINKLTPPIPERLSWAYTAYGILLYNDKDYEHAYTILTDALKLSPKDETILYNYGLTCVEMDLKDQLEDARAKLDALNSPRLADLEKAIKSKSRKR